MPELNESSLELKRIYAERFDAMAGYRDAVWKILTKAFFQKFISAQARILDLGCGYGEFINNITAAKKFAMDLNPNARKRLDPDVQLFEQDCSAAWPLPEASLDVVFTSNFFEHLPDKATLRRTLAEAHRCLAPGGKLIALGPNIRFLPGSYWDFWDHYLPLTEISLAEGLSHHGFRVPVKTPRFLPYTMARGRRLPLFLIRLYLRLPFVWPLFGKQFLIIAEKP